MRFQRQDDIPPSRGVPNALDEAAASSRDSTEQTSNDIRSFVERTTSASDVSTLLEDHGVIDAIVRVLAP